jgi:pimeloyl-ACP methyl ester carboxylesterase
MSSKSTQESQIIRRRYRMHLALQPQTMEERWHARPVTAADAPTLAQLMWDAYQGTIDDNNETPEDALAEMQNLFAGEDGPLLEDCSFVIERDGQALAAALVVRWTKTGRPLLSEVFAHPSAKYQGMGRFLIQKSINALLAQGCDGLDLFVTHGNLPAQHLYESVGFRVAATTFERGLAEVNGTRLYYELRGEGQPLVLIHSGLATSRMWDEQAWVFAQRHRVVLYDLRGFGRSGMPPGPFSNRADLAALLRFLGVERAVLLGSSMGGQLAIDFALEYPEMVAALILVGAGISGKQPSDYLVTRWAEIDAAATTGDIARAVELELRLWVDGPGRAPEQVDPAARELVREMNTDNFRRAPEQEQGQPQALEPPALSRLGQIRAPTLVLVGEHDVPDTLESAERLARGIPGASKLVLPGTAHLPSLEQPEVFNRLVLEFLQEMA